MQHKSFEILEAKADGDAGTFEALVAVFGNVDLVGDRILPGAFAKSLEKWQASGDPIPVILSHQADNPMAHIGVAEPSDVMETERGLVVKGRLDIQDNDVAKQVYKLMKRRSLKEFSFGYRVPKGGEKRAKDGTNELSQLDLFEVGPTLKGANPETELQAVKKAVEEPVAEIVGEDLWRNLSQDVKDRLTARVQPILDNAKSAVEDTSDEDRFAGKSEVQDPLRKRADDMALDFVSAGLSRSKPPKPKPEPERQEPPTGEELRRKANELMLELLTGGISE